MQILENLFDGFAPPKTPVHVGEVMVLWTGMAALDEGRALLQGLMCQTNDSELKRVIEHYLREVDEPLARRVSDFLRAEGVPLPPVTPDKPQADPREFPQGAKFTDSEIANMFAAKLVGALQICQAGLLQALRTDVGSLLLGAQTQLFHHSLILKGLMQKRGWLKVPPFWMPPAGTR